MRTSIFILFAIVLAMANSGFAQPQEIQAILIHAGPPFTSHCHGLGDTLGGHTLVFLYVDRNDNGPDSTDYIPDCLTFPGMACIPEFDVAANFYNFPLDTNGGFISPTLLIEYGLMHQGDSGSFYLRIFFGDMNDSCYTSRLFILSEQNPFTEVIFGEEDWTCGPADVTPPPCHPTAAEIDFLTPGGPEIHCLEICAGSHTYLACPVGSNPWRPPVIQIISGCEENCAATAGWEFDPGSWWLGYSAWMGPRVTGSEVGCMTLMLLPEVLSAVLDTFIVGYRDSAMEFTWNTSREITLAGFELWRVYPHHLQPGVFIGEVPAHHDSSGSSYEFTAHLAFSENFRYVLVMVDEDGSEYAAGYARAFPLSAREPGKSGAATKLILYQNYPNPFNSMTEIRFDLPELGHVKIEIYNIFGQEVAKLTDEYCSAGLHRVFWDGRNSSGASVGSGIYLCRLRAGMNIGSRKMILIR